VVLYIEPHACSITDLNNAALTSHRAAPSRATALHKELESDLQYPRMFGQPKSLTAPDRAASIH
jgi:hypothetical protein